MPNGTPDTLAYMVLGYVLAGIIFGALLVYLFMKSRRIQAENRMLDELETETRQTVHR